MVNILKLILFKEYTTPKVGPNVNWTLGDKDESV